jgi:hypothetical protein
VTYDYLILFQLKHFKQLSPLSKWQDFSAAAVETTTEKPAMVGFLEGKSSPIHHIAHG